MNSDQNNTEPGWDTAEGRNTAAGGDESARSSTSLTRNAPPAAEGVFPGNAPSAADAVPAGNELPARIAASAGSTVPEHREAEEETDLGRVLSMAMNAGEILLENGAEIQRVEDTMTRLSAAFGVEYCNYFVLSNGIFTTGAGPEGEKNRRTFAKVEHIPVMGTRLDRIIAVNQLSRDVSTGQCTLEECEQRLEEIRKMPAKPAAAQILAAGVGSACFALLFGGTFPDAVSALIVGSVLWTFVLFFSSKYLGKIMGNIAGGFLITACCMFLYHLGCGESMNHIIIGAVMPLVPGMAFTNGIRDIGNGDYLSGVVRLLDAILVFLCIAVGVGLMYVVYWNYIV